MTPPQPPTARAGTPSEPPPFHGTDPYLHYSAAFVAVLGVTGLLLPPRGLGFRTTMLSASVFMSTNQLAYDYTGRSINERFADRFARAADSLNSTPEPMQRAKEAMRIERERRAAAAGRPVEPSKNDWVREWDEKEKKVLAEGRGYGGLIMDQIKEVMGIPEEPPKSDAKGGQESNKDK